MDRTSFAETIRSLRNRMPFRPFTALVNGNRNEVDTSEVLALDQGKAVLLSPGSVLVFFDHESVSQILGDFSGRGAENS